MPPGTLFSFIPKNGLRERAQTIARSWKRPTTDEISCVELLQKEAASGRRAAIHRYLHMGGKLHHTRRMVLGLL